MPTFYRWIRVLLDLRATRGKQFLWTVLLAVVFVYILQRAPIRTTNGVDISWAEREKCPACVGDTCELLHRGNFVKAESDRYLKKGIVSTGMVGGIMVVAKTLNKEQAWQRYEKFICRSSPRPQVCNASSFILETVLVTDAALTLTWLREAWRITQEQKTALSHCGSARFVQELKQLYIENGSRSATKLRRAYLSTSLHLNEESVLLRYFTTKSTTPWPFPKFYGACGRVIVVEHAGRTLDAFLDSPWNVRADIAVQLLQLVDTLRERDPDWVLLLTDISFENFAVDSHGQLRLIDLDDVMVFDRRTAVGSHQEKVICNEECYMDWQKKITSDQDHCKDFHKYTQMMYASICARLLSNLLEHPDRHDWGDEGDFKVKEEIPGKGLLHDPPVEIRGPLESALGQCVEETHPRGRLDAVLTLKQTLKMTHGIKDTL
ncbi:divergent protein kinase domain 2A-like [Branchiostoma floridae x Branchiostoma japonicum]